MVEHMPHDPELKFESHKYWVLDFSFYNLSNVSSNRSLMEVATDQFSLYKNGCLAVLIET